MRRKLFSFFALLLMAVTSAWADVDMKTVPLTLEAKTAGTIVVSNPQVGMQYSLNGGAKTAVTSDPIEVSAGQTVAFFGNGTSITSYYTSDEDYTNIAGGTAECYIYGNIMSLVNESGFAEANTLTGDNAFRNLFKDNTLLLNHATNELVLPATTLTEWCYTRLFYGCTSLSEAPALPATTMVRRCYSHMFMKCESLTAAPTLPATTLGVSCYASMFSGCTSLSSAPALPATTLADSCYTSMFRTCTSLTTAPALPAETLASNCYHSMFWGSGLTAVPELPATTLTQECYRSMFTECASLTTIPENLLHATTLAKSCYSGMFNKSGLTSISENLLPATTLADSCYNSIFANTALTAIPEDLLPATTLAKKCYGEMFRGCTTLTTIPEDLLSATTLTDSCYFAMFFNCDGLTTVPANLLPATTLASNCYRAMFDNCDGLTTVPANLLPATTLAEGCYSLMFYGCSGLTAAPILPAEILADYCYYRMFYSCPKLDAVTCFATDISATDATFEWLRYAKTSSGRFIKASTMKDWPRSYNGIPSAWAVVDYDEDLCTPLTLEAKTAGTIVVSYPKSGMKYSMDGGITKNPVPASIEVAIGDKVQFYGNGTSINNYDGTQITGGTADCYIYGNIMSLVNETAFEDAFVLTGSDYTFNALFSGNTHLYNHGSNALKLPASTLIRACYQAMFQGCTNLTAAPELPAKTLANLCYKQMFEGCTGLTTAPELPATTLKSSCYYQMFKDCTGLTTAPTLPAKTSANYCYYQMFKDCSSLNSVSCLATSLSASNPTTNWLSGVAATGTFTKATSGTWATGVTGIPDGWTIVNNDPVTLTDGEGITALTSCAGQVCTVNYSREFTEGKPSTVCLPFAYEKKTGEKFYTFTGITKDGDDFVATMTEYAGATLVANTPYLYVAASTGATDFSDTYTLPASITAGTTTSGDWKFKGTYTTTEWGAEAPTGIYGFSAKSAGGIGQGEFVKAGAYVRVKPLRCYLMYKDGTEDYEYKPAKSLVAGKAAVSEPLPEKIIVRLIDADGEVTGIGTMNTQTGEVSFDNDAWYTLDGILLREKPTKKGIYVHGGKKVMINL